MAFTAQCGLYCQSVCFVFTAGSIDIHGSKGRVRGPLGGMMGRGGEEKGVNESSDDPDILFYM